VPPYFLGYLLRHGKAIVYDVIQDKDGHQLQKELAYRRNRNDRVHDALHKQKYQGLCRKLLTKYFSSLASFYFGFLLSLGLFFEALIPSFAKIFSHAQHGFSANYPHLHQLAAEGISTLIVKDYFFLVLDTAL
jgi:hypothetical protein